MPHPQPSERLTEPLEHLGSGAVSAVTASVLAGFSPPPRLTIADFSDSELKVTSGQAIGSRWRTDSWQRAILDSFHEPGVETVVLVGSSQTGKTSLALCLVTYHILHDPCPILVVEPTEKPMATDFSKNRLDPLIRAVPALAERVDRRRSPEGSSTTLEKTFKGGLLALAGANSPASLAARPIRLLILDEVERYKRELKGEGSTIRIALARTKSFGRRRRVFIMSSPNIEGGPIDEWHARGDQRRFLVPCPECGVYHHLEWANVRWKDGDPSTARIHCPECDYGMDDADRKDALDRVEWEPQNPDRADKSIVSWHVWEAYSYRSSMARIVADFIAARAVQKTGDSTEMHTWQNTTLGESVPVVGGDGVESDTLILRKEEYRSPAPAGVAVITQGVDVQDDRLELLVIGWGPGEEAWLVDRQEFPGDTQQPEPWAELTKHLAREYRHETGALLPISATGIDSAGHRTNIVYEYVRQHGARRVYATIGRDGPRPIVSSPSRPRRGAVGRKVPLYTVGVDSAKSVLVDKLKTTEAGPGYVHIPKAPWADDELCAQLASERRQESKHRGRPIHRWVKTRARNEMLDCGVLALWALRLLHPDLELLHQKLYDHDTAPEAPRTERINPVTGRPAGSYWRRR